MYRLTTFISEIRIVHDFSLLRNDAHFTYSSDPIGSNYTSFNAPNTSIQTTSKIKIPHSTKGPRWMVGNCVHSIRRYVGHWRDRSEVGAFRKRPFYVLQFRRVEIVSLFSIGVRHCSDDWKSRPFRWS